MKEMILLYHVASPVYVVYEHDNRKKSTKSFFYVGDISHLVSAARWLEDFREHSDAISLEPIT